MKTDARVKYTKMVLKKALLELMQCKPINKITVKAVCVRAELNRATFYAHFSDCFDLLKSIEEELEMLYLCLSNGLLSIVLEGYDRFDRQTVIRFVEQMYRQATKPYLETDATVHK